MAKNLYIFIHTHKCAGTTFAHFLSKAFATSAQLPIYYHHATRPFSSEHPEKVEAQIKNISSSFRKKIQVIYGHGAYYGIHQFFKGRPRYITLLRDPIARTLSQYRFELKSNQKWGHAFSTDVLGTRGTPKPFTQWLQLPKNRNYLCCFLFERLFPGETFKSNERDFNILKQRLGTFYAVESTATVSELINTLSVTLFAKPILDKLNTTETNTDLDAFSSTITPFVDWDLRLFRDLHSLSYRTAFRQNILQKPLALTGKTFASSLYAYRKIRTAFP